MAEGKKYDGNFTAGGILYNEFSALSDYLLQDDFESLVLEDVQENRILAIDTFSSRKRIVSEIIRRHKTMPMSFWEFFQTLNEREAKLALFYVCLKTYPLVFDLHFNVAVIVQKKGGGLNEFSVQMRMDELTTTAAEMESWTELTLKKLNTQYRKALKDAGLLKNEYLQTPLGIPDVFWHYFKDAEEAWFLQACFTH